MSAGISGSNTVFRAATMSAVICSSSSLERFEPSTGVPPSASDFGGFAVRMSRSTLPSITGTHSSKELVRLLERLEQGVHLILGIVHGERGPARRRDTEALHERLRAVMPGPDRHPRPVDDG